MTNSCHYLHIFVGGVLESLSSLSYGFIIFIKYKIVLTIISALFLPIFFLFLPSSPLGTGIMCIVIPQLIEALFFPPVPFISLCDSFWLVSIAVSSSSLIFSSAISNLPLLRSGVFFF